MSDLTITVSGCTGSGKTTLTNALRKFLQQEGYNLTDVDDLVEFLKEGQKTDADRDREQRATETVKEIAEITLKEETVPDQRAQDILDQIRMRHQRDLADARAEARAEARADTARIGELAKPPSESKSAIEEKAMTMIEQIRAKQK